MSAHQPPGPPLVWLDADRGHVAGPGLAGLHEDCPVILPVVGGQTRGLVGRLGGRRPLPHQSVRDPAQSGGQCLDQSRRERPCLYPAILPAMLPSS